MQVLTSHSRPPVPCSRGFTLLELLLVIVVLGVLSSLLFLRLAPLLSQTRLRSAVWQVATDLQAIRMKAIAQNRRFRVTFRPSTRDYIVEKEEEGWQQQILYVHGSGATDDAPLLLPPGVVITAVNSGGDVIFVPRGHVDGGISITLGTEGHTRKVVVNLAGRVRIE